MIYVASTGSLMFVTVAIVLIYFYLPTLWAALPSLWAAIREILKGKNPDEESMVGGDS